jgi:chromatin remodeling complex protein RSC6
MPNKSKTSSTTKTVTETPNVVEATSTKPTKKVVAKKTKPVVTETVEAKPVVTETVEPTNVVVESTVTEEVTLAEMTNAFQGKMQQLTSLLSNIKSDFRALEKRYTRDLKSATKLSSKQKRKSGHRAPSGFVKPTKISKELALFLNKPVDTEMARTEVTKDINKYIVANKLQDKNNGRQINPDDKLSALLKLSGSTEVLTYFNLQKYMSPHFAKASKPTTDGSVIAPMADTIASASSTV